LSGRRRGRIILLQIESDKKTKNRIWIFLTLTSRELQMNIFDTLGKRQAAGLSVILLTLTAFVAGCGDNKDFDMAKWFKWPKAKTAAPTTQPAEPEKAKVDVPEPVNMLLPQKIKIHPFTVTRTFDQSGGIRGVDVRLEVLNSFEEATKAFGDFRFEIFTHKANSIEPKGDVCGVWEVKPSLLDPKENLRYWNRSQQMYEFKLQWDQPIPVGRKFVLVAVFTSPFTPRMTAEQIFTSGE